MTFAYRQPSKEQTFLFQFLGIRTKARFRPDARFHLCSTDVYDCFVRFETLEPFRFQIKIEYGSMLRALGSPKRVSHEQVNCSNGTREWTARRSAESR